MSRVRVDLADLKVAQDHAVERFFVGFPMSTAHSGVVEAEVIPKGKPYQGGLMGTLFELKDGAKPIEFLD